LKGLVPEKVLFSDLRKPRLRHALPSLVSYIRTMKPDIVFSTLGYLNLALLAARPVLPTRTRIVVREANMPSLSLARSSCPVLYRAAYRLLYPKADAVICTSQKMMDEMARDFSLPANRLCLLPNPVNEDILRDAAKPILRKDGEGLRLVASGRLCRQKGFDRLINMMTKMDKNTHLTILGEGPEQENLEEQVRELGQEDRILFAGFCVNPWTYYAGSDVFVMSSRWEGMSNAVLEALACGTRVIATPESGGVNEVASLAPPGAVMVAEAGEQFIEALKTYIPSSLTTISPRPSLLPEGYRVSVVVKAFQNLIESLPR